MAERLTKKIVKTIQDKYSLGNYLYYDFAEIDDTNKLLNKLGKLEDIFEKYGIDIQNLDYILEDYSKNQGRDFAICEERDTLRQERDAWKRACELACQIIISGYCDGMEDTTDWESVIYQWKEDNGIETYGIGVEELLGYLLEQAKTERNDDNR